MKKFVGSYVDFYDVDLKMEVLESETLEEAKIKLLEKYWFSNDPEGFKDWISEFNSVEDAVKDYEECFDCTVNAIEI